MLCCVCVGSAKTRRGTATIAIPNGKCLSVLLLCKIVTPKAHSSVILSTEIDVKKKSKNWSVLVVCVCVVGLFVQTISYLLPEYLPAFFCWISFAYSDLVTYLIVFVAFACEPTFPLNGMSLAPLGADADTCGPPYTGPGC